MIVCPDNVLQHALYNSVTVILVPSFHLFAAKQQTVDYDKYSSYVLYFADDVIQLVLLLADNI